MFVHQTIQHPLGINVYGSALIRVEPDIAQIVFMVSKVENHPKDAFRGVRELAQSVQKFLSQSAVEDVQSSRINLSRASRWNGNRHEFVGYDASVTFNVLLHNLNRLEEILSGAVDAGVENISSVQFQTTHLKELRAEARKRAVAAAREKAELYCEAANVKLGKVLHIEDVDPTRQEVNRGHESNVQNDASLSEDDNGKAFNPGSITVQGAVMMAFAFVE